MMAYIMKSCLFVSQILVCVFKLDEKASVCETRSEEFQVLSSLSCVAWCVLMSRDCYQMSQDGRCYIKKAYNSTLKTHPPTTMLTSQGPAQEELHSGVIKKSNVLTEETYPGTFKETLSNATLTGPYSLMEEENGGRSRTLNNMGKDNALTQNNLSVDAREDSSREKHIDPLETHGQWVNETSRDPPHNMEKETHDSSSEETPHDKVKKTYDDSDDSAKKTHAVLSEEASHNLENIAPHASPEETSHDSLKKTHGASREETSRILVKEAQHSLAEETSHDSLKKTHGASIEETSRILVKKAQHSLAEETSHDSLKKTHGASREETSRILVKEAQHSLAEETSHDSLKETHGAWSEETTNMFLNETHDPSIRKITEETSKSKNPNRSPGVLPDRLTLRSQSNKLKTYKDIFQKTLTGLKKEIPHFRTENPTEKIAGVSHKVYNQEIGHVTNIFQIQSKETDPQSFMDRSVDINPTSGHEILRKLVNGPQTPNIQTTIVGRTDYHTQLQTSGTASNSVLQGSHSGLTLRVTGGTTEKPSNDPTLRPDQECSTTADNKMKSSVSTQGTKHGSTQGIQHGSTQGTKHGSTQGTQHGSTQGTQHGSTQGTKHGSTQGTKHGSTQGTKHGSTQGTKHGSTQGTKHGTTQGTKHGSTQGIVPKTTKEESDGATQRVGHINNKKGSNGGTRAAERETTTEVLDISVRGTEHEIINKDLEGTTQNIYRKHPNGEYVDAMQGTDNVIRQKNSYRRQGTHYHIQEKESSHLPPKTSHGTTEFIERTQRNDQDTTNKESVQATPHGLSQETFHQLAKNTSHSVIPGTIFDTRQKPLYNQKPGHGGSRKFNTSHPKPDVFLSSYYRIVTQTGTEKDSDTECYVHLNISGEDGSEYFYLDNPGDEMYLGANDTFRFTSPKNIGKITRMILNVTKFGIKPGWFVVGIEVKRRVQYKRHSETEIYYSDIRKWFQSMEGWLFFNTKPDNYVMSYRLITSYRIPRE